MHYYAVSFTFIVKVGISNVNSFFPSLITVSRKNREQFFLGKRISFSWSVSLNHSWSPCRNTYIRHFHNQTGNLQGRLFHNLNQVLWSAQFLQVFINIFNGFSTTYNSVWMWTYNNRITSL